MAVAIDKYICPFCGQKTLFVGVHDDEGNYKGRPGCEYESDPWSGLCYAIHHDGWGDCILCTDAHDLPLGGCFFDTAEEAFQAIPTLTPPNEWISVEDEIPSDDDDGLEFFCMTNATGKCGGVLPLEWEVATVRGKTVRRWKWRSRISPWAITHWMKRPAPPGENNNVPTKAPNEPLTLEQLREMVGQPVFLVTGEVSIHEQLVASWEILIDWEYSRFDFTRRRKMFHEKDYGITWIAYRYPPEGEEDK